VNAPIFLELERQGVHLSVSPSGELEAEGKPETLDRLLPSIRENKAALLSELLEAKNEAFEERAAILEYEAGFPRGEAERLARAEQAGPKVSYWWRLHFPGDVVRVHFVPSGDTHDGILRAHPEAIAAEPFELSTTTPPETLSEAQEAAIRSWLASIDERSQAVIDEVLAACNRSKEYRAYALKPNKEH